MLDVSREFPASVCAVSLLLVCRATKLDPDGNYVAAKGPKKRVCFESRSRQYWLITGKWLGDARWVQTYWVKL